MRTINRPRLVIAALSFLLPIAGLALAAGVLGNSQPAPGKPTTCPHCGQVVVR
jgi:hypothetical protein